MFCSQHSFYRSSRWFSIPTFKLQTLFYTISYFGESMISKDNVLYYYNSWSTESGGGHGHGVYSYSLTGFSGLGGQYLGTNTSAAASFVRLSNGNLMFLRHEQATDFIQIRDASLSTVISDINLGVIPNSFALSFDERYLFVSYGPSSMSIFSLSGNTLTYLTTINATGYQYSTMECW